MNTAFTRSDLRALAALGLLLLSGGRRVRA
jgi:hypothetical protein